MRRKAYWAMRAIALEYHIQSGAEKPIAQIARLYRRAVSNIQNEIKRIRRELAARGGLSEEAWDELLKQADSDLSFRELRSLLAQTDDPETMGSILNRIDAQAYGARITRLDAVKNKILAELTRAAAAEQAICETFLTGVLQEAYYTNVYNLAKGYNAGVAFDTLPSRAVRRALREPWKGENYSGRIWKHSRAFTEQVERTVVTGLLQGASVPKMAAELTAFTDRADYVCTRLVRTETAHFMGEGQREAYDAAGVRQYRFLAALSERTCEICGGLDSRVFYVNDARAGVNYPTIHPHCRCTTIPADAKLSGRLARDPETGRNYRTGDMSFSQWRESLTPEQKQAFQLHVRQFKNKSADSRQYARYIQRLGAGNMPETFDKFQKLKYTDVKTWTELKGFYKYKGENPRAGKEHYMIQKELSELNLNFGTILPPEKIRAYILPDFGAKRDPYHIMHRMKERNITDDEVRAYADNALVMQSQWGGKRIRYYSDNGISVIMDSSDGWIYKTAWKKEDFGEDVDKIMEVIHKYVK